MKINFTFASLSMCILVTNLFLILIYFIMRRRTFLANVGYQMISIFLLLAVIRFFIPFEFIGISHTIYYPTKLSCIIANFQYPRFSLLQTKYSIWNIVQFFWILGIFFSSISYIVSYSKFISLLKKSICTSEQSQYYNDYCNDICHSLSKKKNFKVLVLNNISTPMVSYWKGYYILIPSTLELPKEQLHLILLHEIHHIIHHDFLIKHTLSILNIIYWWNPVSYLLKKECNLFLEIRIDNLMVAHDDHTRLSYLELLLTCAKNTLKYSVTENTIPFISKNDDELNIRFTILTQRKRKYSFSITTLAIAFILGIFLLSYIFIFEAYYVDPSITNDPEIILPTPENAYFIEKDNGIYEIYINNEYSGSDYSLKYFDPNIPVYQERTYSHVK